MFESTIYVMGMIHERKYLRLVYLLSFATKYLQMRDNPLQIFDSLYDAIGRSMLLVMLNKA